MTTQATSFRSLADLLSDPAASDPPKAVIPRLTWQGRTTLLAGREKGGKSTMLASAAACVSAGLRFLDGHCLQGPVLWLGLEEHVADIASRFQRFGADPAQVFIAGRLSRPFEELDAAAQRHRPALIVIDTLAAFVEEMIEDARESAVWTPIMLQFTRLAHSCDAAVALLHHARKSDGAYRDSTAIGAGVDAIIEMRSGGGDSTIRHLKSQSRFPVPKTSMRFTGTGFELVGESDPERRIVAFVAEHPGCSKRAVIQGVDGKAETVNKAVDQLISRGALENRGGPGRFKLFVPQNREEGKRSGNAPASADREPFPVSHSMDGRGKRSEKATEAAGVSHTLTLGEKTGTAGEPVSTAAPEALPGDHVSPGAVSKPWGAIP